MMTSYCAAATSNHLGRQDFAVAQLAATTRWARLARQYRAVVVGQVRFISEY